MAENDHSDKEKHLRSIRDEINIVSQPHARIQIRYAQLGKKLRIFTWPTIWLLSPIRLSSQVLTSNLYLHQR